MINTKVLILSDSHGLRDEISDIKERHQVDNMIHCGDSELDKDTPELKDLVNVAGNCDFDKRFPEVQTITINKLLFFVTHGHLYGVKKNLMKLAYRAAEENAQVVCFGHTHVAGAEKVGKQLFINPGSIRYPRNRVERTYAIMEWNLLDNIQVNFYTMSGELVEDLSYETSLK